MNEKFGLFDRPYKVVADHPILARPDKRGMKFEEAREYANELVAEGFENVSIQPDGWTRQIKEKI